MSFEQLVHATKICNDKFSYFTLIHEWEIKRENLLIYSKDLIQLVREYKSADKRPYPKNPKITLINQIPRIRLSSACEASTNCLYSMAEIAAQFGNRASKGLFPSSFNNLRKKIEKGEYPDLPFNKWVNDLQWYKKIREIRTEWTHHSSVFIGEEENEPIMVIRCHRRPSDREEFKKAINIKVPELINWIKKAIETIDNYGNLLLVQFILPAFDLDKKLISPKYDENGFPIFKNDNRLEVNEITVKEHLAKCGINFNR